MKRTVIIIVVIIVFISLAIFLLRKENSHTITQDINQVTNAPTDMPTPSLILSPTNTITASINDGVNDFVTKVTTALQAGNASQFQNLLVNDEIVLGSDTNGGTPATVSKTDILLWLNQHWSSNLSFVSKRYIDHFGYWELATKGWSNTNTGEVDFRLFRYDTNGQRQAFSGNWLIYAVVY